MPFQTDPRLQQGEWTATNVPAQDLVAARKLHKNAFAIHESPGLVGKFHVDRGDGSYVAGYVQVTQDNKLRVEKSEESRREWKGKSDAKRAVEEKQAVSKKKVGKGVNPDFAEVRASPVILKEIEKLEKKSKGFKKNPRMLPSGKSLAQVELEIKTEITDLWRAAEEEQRAGMGRRDRFEEIGVMEKSKVKRQIMGGVLGLILFNAEGTKIEREAHALSKKAGLTQQDLRKLKTQFRLIDVDDSGTIDRKEFMSYLNINSTPFTDALCQMYDADNNGVIDFEEFICAQIKYCAMNQEAILQFCFDAVDKDKSETISEEQVVAIVQALHNNFDQPSHYTGNTRKCLQRFEMEEDGYLDFTQFLATARRYPMIFYPAFQLQGTLQEGSLGEKRWLRLAADLYRKSQIWEFYVHNGHFPIHQVDSLRNWYIRKKNWCRKKFRPRNPRQPYHCRYSPMFQPEMQKLKDKEQRRHDRRSRKKPPQTGAETEVDLAVLVTGSSVTPIAPRQASLTPGGAAGTEAGAGAGTEAGTPTNTNTLALMSSTANSPAQDGVLELTDL
jgi:Ca2+-binding EF-hand superfamily protein